MSAQTHLSRLAFAQNCVYTNDAPDDAAQWCREQFGEQGDRWSRHGILKNTFMFKNDRDRAMFKLIWWRQHA